MSQQSDDLDTGLRLPEVPTGSRLAEADRNATGGHIDPRSLR